ncbi:hypothetical protein SDJN02_21198, partial [Cucurbita argyrosperma subsp. argyrosperma]
MYVLDDDDQPGLLLMLLWHLVSSSSKERIRVFRGDPENDMREGTGSWRQFYFCELMYSRLRFPA